MSGGTSASTVASASTTAASNSPTGVGAWLSLGLQTAGTVMGARAAIQQSTAQKRALDYQAKVAANNAQLEAWKAHDAVLRGQNDAARWQLNARQLKGTQRAEMAARGIDLGEGSALHILTDTDYMAAIDTNTILDNAAKESWAHQSQASDFSANAEMYRMRSRAENPALAGFSTLLTGATSVAKSWYDFKQKGTLA